VVKPNQQRAAATYLMDNYDVSQRRVSQTLGRARSTLRYRMRDRSAEQPLQVAPTIHVGNFAIFQSFLVLFPPWCLTKFPIGAERFLSGVNCGCMRRSDEDAGRQLSK
jgi:hypothetical protein